MTSLGSNNGDALDRVQEKKLSHTMQLMTLIDKNKDKLNDADYLDMCNHLKYVKIKEDKINKSNLYKIKYLKQSVISNCMNKGFCIVTKIKVCEVIIEPEIFKEIQEYKDIQMYNCLIHTKSDNSKILHKSNGCLYTLCEDEEEDDIIMNFRKIILLKIDSL